MAASYNNSVWFYDRLSRLVYGRALINAQVYLLQFIPAGANVLIVGGGTGWILEELTKIHPSGLQITYVEVSKDMIVRSKQRDAGLNKVTFVNDAIENLNIEANFDVVVTPFLFDNFTDETMQMVFSHISCMLKPDAMWLNADFQLTGKWWQPILLKTMLLFFRLICGIESSELPDIEKQFEVQGYEIIKEMCFYGDFVAARVYKQI